MRALNPELQHLLKLQTDAQNKSLFDSVTKKYQIEIVKEQNVFVAKCKDLEDLKSDFEAFMLQTLSQEFEAKDYPIEIEWTAGKGDK